MSWARSHGSETGLELRTSAILLTRLETACLRAHPRASVCAVGVRQESSLFVSPSIESFRVDQICAGGGEGQINLDPIASVSATPQRVSDGHPRWRPPDATRFLCCKPRRRRSGRMRKPSRSPHPGTVRRGRWITQREKQIYAWIAIATHNNPLRHPSKSFQECLYNLNRLHNPNPHTLLPNRFQAPQVLRQLPVPVHEWDASPRSCVLVIKIRIRVGVPPLERRRNLVSLRVPLHWDAYQSECGQDQERDCEVRQPTCFSCHRRSRG